VAKEGVVRRRNADCFSCFVFYSLILAKKEKHPFVVEVFGGFQTRSHIILYLEFCQGGDLMHHINTGGKFSLERTR
jgi:serine/threonine protein kinase